MLFYFLFLSIPECLLFAGETSRIFRTVRLRDRRARHERSDYTGNFFLQESNPGIFYALANKEVWVGEVTYRQHFFRFLQIFSHRLI